MLREKLGCLILLVLYVLCFSLRAAQSEPAADTDKQAIEHLFANYMAHYNGYLQGDELKDIERLYMPTIMLMSTNNAPQSIDAPSFVMQVSKFLDNLKHQGAASVNWQQVNIRLIDENIAIATNLAVRYRDNGEVFNKVGATYFLYKTGKNWRIASFAVHEHTGVQTL
ncbi:DUF6841 family protein [Pseudoalteromonas sp. T1lg48]|uniref:DUF6841 family protein n=1 Tax=Pseudoalteromonas sp. T1lg48 TaxID=2077100 RepID=UPI000CF70DA3|nr:hypothetical protein [Pseudoalteromonas sp. T1lg48]